MKVVEDVWFWILPRRTPHHLKDGYFYKGMNRKQ